jgi:hypothetical protein
MNRVGMCPGICAILATLLLLFVLTSPSMQHQLVESGRLWVDYFTCTPQSHDQMLPGFNRQQLEQRTLDDTCYHVKAANMDGPILTAQLSSVYVAQAEMARLFNCSTSSEADFMTAMLANVTGNLVADGNHADFVFVPFPATATCSPSLGRDALPLALAAVAHFPGQKVTLNRRPFPSRTNAHRPMRQLLVDFPEVSPPVSQRNWILSEIYAIPVLACVGALPEPGDQEYPAS